MNNLRTVSKPSYKAIANTVQVIDSSDSIVNSIVLTESEKLYRPEESDINKAAELCQKMVSIFKKPYAVTERALADKSHIISAEWATKGSSACDPVRMTLYISEALIRLFTAKVEGMGVRLIDALCTKGTPVLYSVAGASKSGDLSTIATGAAAIKDFCSTNYQYFAEGYRFTGDEVASLGSKLKTIFDGQLLANDLTELAKNLDTTSELRAGYAPLTIAAFCFDWLKSIACICPPWTIVDTMAYSSGKKGKRLPNVESFAPSVSFNNFTAVSLPDGLTSSNIYDTLVQIINTEAWFSYIANRSAITSGPNPIYVKDKKTRSISLNAELLSGIAERHRNNLIEQMIPYIKQKIKFAKHKDDIIDYVRASYFLACIDGTDIPEKIRIMAEICNSMISSPAQKIFDRTYKYNQRDELVVLVQATEKEALPLIDKLYKCIKLYYRPLSVDDLGHYCYSKGAYLDTDVIYRLECQKQEEDPLLIMDVHVDTAFESASSTSGDFPVDIRISPVDTQRTLVKKNVIRKQIPDTVHTPANSKAILWEDGKAVNKDSFQASMEFGACVKVDRASLESTVKDLTSYYSISYKPDAKALYIKSEQQAYCIMPPRTKANVVKLGHSRGGKLLESTKDLEFTIEPLTINSTVNSLKLLLCFPGSIVLGKSSEELKALYESRLEHLTTAPIERIKKTLYNKNLSAMSINKFKEFVFSCDSGSIEPTDVIRSIAASIWLPNKVVSRHLLASDKIHSIPVEVLTDARAIIVRATFPRVFLSPELKEYFSVNPKNVYEAGPQVLENAWVTDNVYKKNPRKVSIALNREDATNSTVTVEYCVDLLNDVAFAGHNVGRCIVPMASGLSREGVVFTINYPLELLNVRPQSSNHRRVFNSSGVAPFAKVFRDLSRIDVTKSSFENATSILVDQLGSFIGLSYYFNHQKQSMYKRGYFVESLYRYSLELLNEFAAAEKGYEIGLYTDATVSQIASLCRSLGDVLVEDKKAGVDIYSPEMATVRLAIKLYKTITGIDYTERTAYFAETFPASIFDARIIDTCYEDSWTPLEAPSFIDGIQMEPISDLMDAEFAGIFQTLVEDFTEKWLVSRLKFSDSTDSEFNDDGTALTVSKLELERPDTESYLSCREIATPSATEDRLLEIRHTGADKLTAKEIASLQRFYFSAFSSSFYIAEDFFERPDACLKFTVNKDLAVDIEDLKNNNFEVTTLRGPYKVEVKGKSKDDLLKYFESKGITISDNTLNAINNLEKESTISWSTYDAVGKALEDCGWSFAEIKD